jgi:hypothetical protein
MRYCFPCEQIFLLLYCLIFFSIFSVHSILCSFWATTKLLKQGFWINVYFSTKINKNKYKNTIVQKIEKVKIGWNIWNKNIKHNKIEKINKLNEKIEKNPPKLFACVRIQPQFCVSICFARTRSKNVKDTLEKWIIKFEKFEKKVSHPWEIQIQRNLGCNFSATRKPIGSR